MSCSELCTELMQKANIACVPGSAFGMPGFVRFAYAEVEETLVEGLKMLREALK